MFLIALVFSAIGTAIGSVLKDMQGFQLIMNFLVMPLFFFSNALFPTGGPADAAADRRPAEPAELRRGRHARRAHRQSPRWTW